MIQRMPGDFARSVRDLVKDVGQEAAVAVLAAQMRDAPLEEAGNAGTAAAPVLQAVWREATLSGQAGRDRGARSGRY